MKNIILTIIFVFLFFGFSKAQTTEDYSSLKAVLVVGVHEKKDTSAIKSMNEIADFLKIKGVKVFRFYEDEANWNNIKTTSKDANFFIYSGHGSTMGEGGRSGGLCLKTMVSSKEIIEGLQLKSNSVVIFKSVCRGAGSSAGDNGDIGINEALKRVTDYSKPFFDVGASCYYANNLGSGCLSFLRNFFSEKSVKECFELSSKTWSKIEVSKKYKYDSSKQISIASIDWGGTATRTTYINGVKKVEKVASYKSYDIAYVANPDFSVKDMLNF